MFYKWEFDSFSKIFFKFLSETSRLRKSFFIFLWNTLTYLLTPWCRVLLEKLTSLQLVKKFPEFRGTRRFITALTSVRQLFLSWASPIQSIYPHSTSWRSILILITHLRLALPSGLLPSCFPTKSLYTPLSSPIRATCLWNTLTCKNTITNLQWLLVSASIQGIIRPYIIED